MFKEVWKCGLNDYGSVDEGLRKCGQIKNMWRIKEVWTND